MNIKEAKMEVEKAVKIYLEKAPDRLIFHRYFMIQKPPDQDEIPLFYI